MSKLISFSGILSTMALLLLSFQGHTQGTVQFNESANVRSVMDRYVSQNKAESTIKGWRIQIITTDDRRKMNNAISKFRNLYPNISSDWTHLPPYYKVKVGAYENKLQLMGFLLELKQYFPSVIPVMEDIEKRELVIN